MEKIRSDYQESMHEMEWNDSMNLVTSAWWFNFFKIMEPESKAVIKADDK